MIAKMQRDHDRYHEEPVKGRWGRHVLWPVETDKIQVSTTRKWMSGALSTLICVYSNGDHGDTTSGMS